MLDHFGWKWWKASSRDLEQVKLELIDIWHFGLSLEILANSGGGPVERDTIKKTAADIRDRLTQGLVAAKNSLDGDVPDFDIGEGIEALAAKAVAEQRFGVPEFAALMVALELSFDELYWRYIGKNVLNFFRQDHGYANGTYQKTWRGREDNEHLAEIVPTLDLKSSDLRGAVYTALSRRYAECVESLP